MGIVGRPNDSLLCIHTLEIRGFRFPHKRQSFSRSLSLAWLLACFVNSRTLTSMGQAGVWKVLITEVYPLVLRDLTPSHAGGQASLLEVRSHVQALAQGYILLWAKSNCSLQKINCRATHPSLMTSLLLLLSVLSQFLRCWNSQSPKYLYSSTVEKDFPILNINIKFKPHKLRHILYMLL